MFFNGRFILNVAEFASKQGADFEHLIELSGYDVKALSEAECRVGPEVYNVVLESALEMTNDPLLGLHLGQDVHLSAAGLVLQIAQTSSTVLEAMEYCCTFSNLLCNALPLSLREQPDYYQIVFQPHPLWQKMSDICVEQTIYGHLSFSVREFQALTHQQYRPSKIDLHFFVKDHQQVLDQTFKCPVFYNQTETALYFDKRHFQEEIRTSDYRLLQVLVEHAQRRSEELALGQYFHHKVQQSVIRLVQPAFPTVQQVAQHLNMSVRTFQRRLKREGYSFKGIVDDLKRDFAIKYLRNHDLTISEIAYLLDYADHSTFVRSFKRWYGNTPSEFRRLSASSI